jgi:predicted TIM-barrel fold metal-dependent hydrolase
MKTVTLEEHFLTEGYVRATAEYSAKMGMQFPEMQAKLLDLGAGRIAAMDEGGVDLQVMSLVAFGLEGLSAEDGTVVAREVNDELASAVSIYPDRLAGFATLALKDVGEATKELERCVSGLGFRGVMVNGTVEGLFLDDARFLPLFEAAAALGVPVICIRRHLRNRCARLTTLDCRERWGGCYRLRAGDGIRRRRCIRFG